MKKFADLHIHTRYSDSTSSPEEVVEQAYQQGLHCIAITDHDTVDGIRPAIESAKKYDIEVIPAIELSSELQGKDIHILGYFFDYKNQNFVERLGYMQNSRMERMEEMILKLKNLGIDDIALEEVCALAESKSVGRPHLATIMKEKGWVKDFKEAFDKYLADDAPAYVPKFKQTPEEAIQFIHEAGGVAVLAHPMLTNVDQLIAGFVRVGLDGLEVYCHCVSNMTISFYEGLAKKYNLLVTGGSDAHGNVKKHTYVGKVKIPYNIVEKLKEKVVFRANLRDLKKEKGNVYGDY